MPKQTVLVTNSHFDSGVCAVRALAAAEYDVVGADFGRLPLGMRSRFARAQHPVSRSSQADMHQDLLEIIRRERPAALLPLGTRFVHAAIVLRDQIEATTAVNTPDLEAFLSAYHKSECIAECSRLGVPHPHVYSLEEARDLLASANKAPRLVVKPDFDAGGAQGVRYVRSTEELAQAVQQCEWAYGNALIQEYIPGGPGCMKTAVLLFGRDSELIAAFTTQKIRQWPREGGLTAFARSTADAAIVRQVLPLFERWRWRGGAEVELKYDRRDGLHKVIEVNPRFPAYLRFAGVCGLNLPLMATALALDGDRVERVPYPGYTVGAAYCSPDAYLRSAAEGLRRDGSKTAALRAMFGEVREAATSLAGVALDPAPAIGRVVTNLFAPQTIRTAFYVLPRGQHT